MTEESQKKLGELPSVLNHNDVFWENILMDKNKKIYLIDFELSIMNVIGSDILVVITELMSDYSSDKANVMIEDMPTDAQLREMITFYCFFIFNEDAFNKFKDGNDLAQEVKNSVEFKNFYHPYIQQILDVWPLLQVMNHCYWIWRAVYNIKYSKSDKDYLNWGNKRVEMLLHDYPMNQS